MKIVKFALTYIDSTGLRMLARPNQTHNFWKTKKEGNQYLKDMLTNNSNDTLTQIFGVKPQFEVRPVEMWCETGDAKRTVFEN